MITIDGDAGGTQLRRSPLSLLTYSRLSAISALSFHIPATANSLTERLPAPRRVWSGETHLVDSPFTGLDIFKGLEDAVFVFCRNCHCRHLTYRSTGSGTALQPSWAMRPTAAVRKARGGMSRNTVPGMRYLRASRW